MKNKLSNYQSDSKLSLSKTFFKNKRPVQNIKLLFTFFITITSTFSYAQISNNFLDYTNGIHGVVSQSVAEHETVILEAPSGTLFTTVNFASYGTPTGTPPSFHINPTCHSSASQSIAEQYILGNNSASVEAENSVFGDPCYGTFKSLSITSTYTQPICSGTSPGTISGTLPISENGPATYSWEKSTTSATTGFVSIPGAHSKDYTPGNLSQTTWFRRLVISGTETDHSAVLQVTVLLKPSATITGTSTVCQNGAVPIITFNGSGGSQPYTFIYKINGGPEQVISTTSGNSATVTQDSNIPGVFVYKLVSVSNKNCSQAVNGTVTIKVNPIPSISASTTFTCVGGKTGTVTAIPNDEQTYTYSINGGAYSSNPVMTGLAAGTHTLRAKNSSGCITSIPVIVSPYPASDDDQSVTSTDAWTAHLYTGIDFQAYLGHFTEPELFDESFGGNSNCFSVLSATESKSIYTENFSVKFRMNSTKKGLYVVDLGSDDGSRLTIDGALVYNNWANQSFNTKAAILINLSGSSNLQYDFYENTGSNRVIFQNLTLLLENKLSENTTQNICLGNTGFAISGDVFGALPNGITVIGTGYQWSYSLTPGGARTDISAATAPSFIPNTSLAPFNAPGTYYLYRTSTVKSTRNTGASSYMPSSVSDAAIITVTSPTSATISYAGTPFCNSSPDIQTVTLIGNTGGTFYASPSGLSLNSMTGEIDPSLSNAGNYAITYSFAATGGCHAFSTATEIHIAHPGEWSGKVNSDWNNPGNWFCNMVPDNATDVIIPACITTYSPDIDGIATVNDLTLEDGACVHVNAILKIGGKIMNSGGHIHCENGTIEMTGASAQSLSGNTFSNNMVKNLMVSNTGPGLFISSAANDTLRISGNLTFEDPISKLFTGDNITLLSDNFSTASVGRLAAGNLITGKVIVERYVNTGGEIGQHNKSWQFLSTPFTGETIKESWMEKGSTEANGYGIQLTGPEGTAGGFDRSSQAPSIKYYNSTTDKWVGVSSTDNLIYEPKGYMVFVRGDRSVNGTTVTNPTPTKLRSKGNLLTGSLLPISVKSGKFESIGNPYASAIDFSLITKDENIEDKFYVWDPYLYGAYGLGGYQTISKVNNWKPVPGGTTLYKSGTANKIIRSGQAFFVHGNVTEGTEASYNLTFTESSKVSTTNSESFARSMGTTEGDVQFFSVSLFTGSERTSLIADGNTVAFANRYSNAVDGNDALKLFNGGENFGLKRQGKILSIEARKPLQLTDTIYYNMSNLKQQTYQLRFAPGNMQLPGLQAFLVDNFLKSKTPISLADSSFINISITPSSGSSAADRFSVIFVPANRLPVTFNSIDANKKNNDIEVKWKVESESDMQQYEIEKSTDAIVFEKVGTEQARNRNGTSYVWLDTSPLTGFNYYRIKSVSRDGTKSYTKIVKVYFGSISPEINIYPNPIVNNTIHLQFATDQTGVYSARLLNSLGQIIISKSIEHTESRKVEKIQLNNKLERGIYHLEIIKPNGKTEVIKVVN